MSQYFKFSDTSMYIEKSTFFQIPKIQKRIIELANSQLIKDIDRRNMIQSDLLKKMEDRLELALQNETDESMSNWLNYNRQVDIEKVSLDKAAEQYAKSITRNDTYREYLKKAFIEGYNLRKENETT